MPSYRRHEHVLRPHLGAAILVTGILLAAPSLAAKVSAGDEVID